MAHRKTSWPPCAACGDPDGPIPSGNYRRTPARYNGALYGYSGPICYACYQAERVKQRQAERQRERAEHDPLYRLATTVLGVRDALAERDMATANERLRQAVRMAEMATVRGER